MNLINKKNLLKLNFVAPKVKREHELENNSHQKRDLQILSIDISDMK